MSVINRTGTPLLEGLPLPTTLSIGTTATIIPLPRNGSTGAVLVKLVNMSTSASIAWTLVPIGAAPPSITATGLTTDGSVMLPGDKEFFGLNTVGRDLYVVASAAATAVNITPFTFVES